jgi:CHAT domain-containing protein
VTTRRELLLGLVAGGVAGTGTGAFSAPPNWPRLPHSDAADVLREARALFEREDFAGALRVLERWFAGGSDAAAFPRAFLRTFAARCARNASRPDRARQHAAEAARLLDAGTGAPPEQAGRLRFQLGAVHVEVGAPARAVEQLAAAMDLLAPILQEEAAGAANLLGTSLSELLRFGDAKRALLRGIGLAEQASAAQGGLAVRLWTNLAAALIEEKPLTNVAEAERAVREARIAAGPDASLQLVADYAEAQLLLHKPDLRAAEGLINGLVERGDAELRGHALHLRASMLFDSGLMPEAAAAAYEALAVYGGSLGTAHPAYGRMLHLLGTAYHEMGDWAAATSFFVRAADVFRTAFGESAPQVHGTEVERAALEVRIGRAQRSARDLLVALGRARRSDEDPAQRWLDSATMRAAAAVRVAAAQRPVDDRLQALALVVQGMVEEARLNPRLDAAGDLYRRAQDRLRDSRGSSSPDLAFSLVRRARLLIPRRSSRDDAQDLLSEAEALYRSHGATSTVRLAEVLTARAELHRVNRQHDRALDHTREALAALRSRIERTAPPMPGFDTQRLGVRELFIAQARMLLRLAPGDASAREEAFAACQEALATGASDALRRTAARLARGNSPLADVVRAREMAAEDLRQIDAAMPRALERNLDEADLQRMRARRAAAAAALEEAQRRLEQAQGATAGYLSQQPATIAEARAALEPDEAMLLLAADDTGSILWLLTRDGAWTDLLDRPTRPEIGGLVATVRMELEDALAAYQAGRALPDFDRTAARTLYDLVIGKAEERGWLDPERTPHLLLVPDGALQRMPLHLLVDGNDDWAAIRYAMTTLPSVAARVMARKVAPSSAPEPFLGFGDVVTGGPAQAACVGPHSSLRQELDCLERLPSTAAQLREQAKSADAPPGSVLLASEATRAAFLDSGPGRYRTLAFATHALMGGVSPWLPEPAIILSAVPGGDGREMLLTASEIATLALDADLVVLSACNTAAPVAGPQPEGLSGLARAFLHAGTRCVLGSHWPVASDAAPELIVAFARALRAEPRPRLAAALQAAMRELRRQDARGFHHPFYWAPFVVVSA